MVTRENFDQIYYLNKELEMWVKKKCEVDYGLKSPQLDKVGKAHSPANSAERQVMIRLQISERIESILDSIQEERAKVYKALELINDSLLRQIIEYRCVQLCSWQEVANAIGHGSADAVKKTYYRAFDKDGRLEEKYLKQ